jgi:thiamine-phosphate pyrophosphorylase
MKSLNHCRLYGILDLNYVNVADARKVVDAMVKGGVDLIQLRAKAKSLDTIVDLAGELHSITHPTSTPLIVNDHADVAIQVPLAGVHVGQDDDSIAIVRGKVSRPIFVGKSTHNFEQAIAAQDEGADYIGFGPIFATPTKPDYAPIGLSDIKRVHANVNLPIFCIGGINIDNLQQVIDAGAKRVAMVSALLRAHDIVDYARCATDMLA